MNSCQIYGKACEIFKMLTANDFNRGYASGICIILAALLVILIIKIVFKIIFRRRKCSELVASSPDGDVTVSISAIEDTVRSEMDNFPSISLRKIRLYRIRKKYQLNLICEYDGKDGGLPEITKKIKQALQKTAQEFFGVDSIRKINFSFDRISRPNNGPAPVITPEPAVDTEKNAETDNVF